MQQQASDRIAALSELAYHAFYWTSMSPDVRGKNTIATYQAELTSDIADMPDAATAEYIDKYATRLRNWLAAHSRCASSMVTGPSNFNITRAAKANASERKRYEEFREWRDRALAKIKQSATPTLGLQEEIAALEFEVLKLEDLQETMKCKNKELKKAGTVTRDAGYYPSFRLTNNLATIKRKKARIAELSRRAISQPVTTSAPHVRIVENTEINRLQLFFKDRPDETTRTLLKRNGFRWTPSICAWQAYINNKSREIAKALL